MTMRNDHYTMIARKAVKSALNGVSEASNVGFGCSGGADSMALLFALSKLYKKDRAKQVHVVIVNHQLQKVTDEISQKVAEFAESFGFNAHIVPVDIVSTGNGMESDAREARYTVFQNMIEKYNLQAFLIGHTKTDQAEQVFLGMLRGSGLRSMSGIREKRDVFIRPFLNVLSRKDTQKVCEENNYDYWCDPQNDSTDYRRVVVRKMISDVEKNTGQDIVGSLARTAQMNAEDAEALEFYTNMAFGKVIESDWDIQVLSSVPAAVRKRLYRKMIIELGAKSDTVGFDMTNRVDDFIVDWHGQKEIYFSNGVRVSRMGKKLVFVS